MSPPYAIGRPRNVTGTTLLFRLRGHSGGGRVSPLMKRLFAQAGPGDGLVDKPVRLSALVSFRGEKRKLGDKELRSLVREPMERAAHETREAPLDEAELEAVASALWGATAMSPRPETSARPRAGAVSTGRGSGVRHYGTDRSPTWASSGRMTFTARLRDADKLPALIKLNKGED